MGWEGFEPPPSSCTVLTEPPPHAYGTRVSVSGQRLPGLSTPSTTPRLFMIISLLKIILFAIPFLGFLQVVVWVKVYGEIWCFPDSCYLYREILPEGFKMLQACLGVPVERDFG